MDVTSMEMAIARAGRAKNELAQAIGLSSTAFWNKIRGTTEFKVSEIRALKEELGLTGDEINQIFFS